jgi:hypothetical protein
MEVAVMEKNNVFILTGEAGKKAYDRIRCAKSLMATTFFHLK